jgi:branched-chain amino acid transport system ATP-binding protein
LTLLSLHGVNAGYGRIRVLWDVELAVDAGRVLCVLGPNGAGKTTMAQVITGTLPVFSGQIRYEGEEITNRTPEARARAGIALVPQGRHVFPELSVRENLEVARFAARSRARSDTRDFIMDLFPKLAELLGAQAGRLSGGEQQMLAVGRALMTEPRLLIMDEPSLGLAPLLVSNLYQSIVRIRERGVAILLIEQVVQKALDVSDQVVLLESGRVGAVGPVGEFDQDRIAEAYLGSGSGET